MESEKMLEIIKNIFKNNTHILERKKLIMNLNFQA